MRKILLACLSLLGVALPCVESASAQTVKKISGNVYDGAGGPLTKGVVWHVTSGGLTVPAGKTLTIQPGAIVKFEGNNFLVAGALRASDCWLTSLSDDAIGGDTGKDGPTQGKPGDWYGIEASGTQSTALQLERVQLRFAGKLKRPSIWCRGNPVVYLKSVEISFGLANGLTLERATGPVEGCTIANCGGYPMVGSLQRVADYKGNKAIANKITDDLMLFVPATLTWPTYIALEKQNSLSGTGVFAYWPVNIAIAKFTALELGVATVHKLQPGSQFYVRDALFKVHGTITTWDDDSIGGRYWKNDPPRLPLRGEGPVIRVATPTGVITELSGIGGELRWAGRKGGGGIEVEAHASVKLFDFTVFGSAGHGIKVTHRNLSDTCYLRNCRFESCAEFPVWGISLQSILTPAAMSRSSAVMITSHASVVISALLSRLRGSIPPCTRGTTWSCSIRSKLRVPPRSSLRRGSS